MDKVQDAVKDFEKSVSLSPMFAVAHVQKCYTGWDCLSSSISTFFEMKDGFMPNVTRLSNVFKLFHMSLLIQLQCSSFAMFKVIDFTSCVVATGVNPECKLLTDSWSKFM